MAVFSRQTKILKCDRCGHTWIPTKKTAKGLPIKCPDCQNPNWNRKQLDYPKKSHNESRKKLKSPSQEITKPT